MFPYYKASTMIFPNSTLLRSVSDEALCYNPTPWTILMIMLVHYFKINHNKYNEQYRVNELWIHFP